MNFALIGYGYWGPNLARNISNLQDSKLKYICDINRKNLERAKHICHDSILTTNYEDILNDKKIDGVLIATSVSEHYKLVKIFLENNIDVFVEKPLASSYKEGKKLVDIATKNNRILMVGHTFLYSPPVREIKKIIDNEELGEIYFISATRVNLGKHQKDASVLWDLAPHDLSMFHYWLNSDPQKVNCIAENYIIKDIPDVAFINLKYSNKICINLEIAWLAPSKLRTIAIIGSKKMLIYNDLENIEKIKIFDKGIDNYQDPKSYGEFQLSYRTGDIRSPFISNHEPLLMEMQDFYNSIKTRENPVSNSDIALSVVKIIEKAEQSYKEDSRFIMI